VRVENKEPDSMHQLAQLLDRQAIVSLEDEIATCA
jgi:hypothetical protein